MKKIRGGFDLYEYDPRKIIGYQEITNHFIFHMNLVEDIKPKYRLVGGGHKTKPPYSITYLSLVSKDSVQMCLMLVAVYELKNLSAYNEMRI